MEKMKRFELNEEELDQISGGTNIGIPKRNAKKNAKSKVWCNTCGGYVDVGESDSGGRTKCIKDHYVDEL